MTRISDSWSSRSAGRSVMRSSRCSMRQRFGALEPPDDAGDFVALLEQQLREVRAVLSGDAGDDCALSHVLSFYSGVPYLPRREPSPQRIAARRASRSPPPRACRFDSAQNRGRARLQLPPESIVIGLEPRRDAEQPRRFHRDVVPRRVPGVHAVIQARRARPSTRCLRRRARCRRRSSATRPGR